MRHMRPGDAATHDHSFVAPLFVEAGVRLVRGESHMYAVPDVEEVVAVAKELGIHLGPEEAVLYRKYLMEQLREFDTFVQARLEEPGPPMVAATRQPGYQPRPDEDPLNAWMWKCRIAGAADGLLAGKTVSYKDHIAVAGMPMSFGSFALEGFVPDFDATVVTRVLQAGGTVIGKNVMNGLSGGFGTGGGIGDYGRPLDAALPHPGIERIFFRRRPVTGLSGGRDHRRPRLLQARLREGVEISQLLHEVFPVQEGLVRTEVDAQLLGHRHHFVDVRDRVHGVSPFAQGGSRLR